MKSLARLPGAQALRSALRRFGLDVVEYGPNSFSWWRTHSLKSEGIVLVLDVGANVGQYAQLVRREGYKGRIVSFEPGSAAFAGLNAAASSDPLWSAEQLALGSRDDSVDLNVAGNSQSSSILPMLDVHLKSAPESAYVGVETVLIRRLDSLRKTLGLGEGPTLLKMDVQGYEMETLKGASETLACVQIVECELSLADLYDGQASMTGVIELLRQLGFGLVALDRGFADRHGELLQLDGLFVRR